MNPPTLPDIARALEGDNIEVLRPMREISVDVGAKVALADYMSQELQPWAERRVQERVEMHRLEQAKWRQARDKALEAAAEGMEMLGISANDEAGTR